VVDGAFGSANQSQKGFAGIDHAREGMSHMPTMTVSLDGLPLFTYEETSPTTTAELLADVEAAAEEKAISVDWLIVNATANILYRKDFLRDADRGFEKRCLAYLILTEPAPPPKGVEYAGTIAEWLPMLDFEVNIVGQQDGFVLEIAKGKISRH
jgi:sulfur carrier protein ThiS